MAHQDAPPKNEANTKEGAEEDKDVYQAAKEASTPRKNGQGTEARNRAKFLS